MKTDSSPVISLATPEEAAVSARRTGAATVAAKLNEERRSFTKGLVGAGLVLPFLGASTAARQLTPDERSQPQREGRGAHG